MIEKFGCVKKNLNTVNIIGTNIKFVFRPICIKVGAVDHFTDNTKNFRTL